MPLHPEVARDLEQNPIPKNFSPTVEEMRVADWDMPLEQRTKIDKISNDHVKNNTYEIPVRIYEYKDDSKIKPVIIFFHGGGFVRCSVETHDDMCRNLAKYTGWKVISPEYRLAPEYKFPVPLEDCCKVVEWAAENAERLRIDPERIAVCGDSAGGNLAGAAAKKFKNNRKIKISKQILIYPVIDFYSKNSETKYESYKKYSWGYGLSSSSMHRYWSFYLGNKEDEDNIYVSLSRDNNLFGLPETFIICSEYDPLSDEARHYAECLEKASVRVEFARYSGLNHAFMHALPYLEECREIYNNISVFLNKEKKL